MTALPRGPRYGYAPDHGRPDPTTFGSDEAKRARIVERAMWRFAEFGYQGTKVEAIAADLGIAKGSIFQHFGSKAGLFFACYRQAVSSLPAWLDAPEDVRDAGFFAVVDYWLGRTEHLVRDVIVPRIASSSSATSAPTTWPSNATSCASSSARTLTGPWTSSNTAIARGEVRDDVDIELVGLPRGLVVGLAPGRAGRRGTRPRTVPPLAPPAGPPTRATAAVLRGAPKRHRHRHSRLGRGESRGDRALVRYGLVRPDAAPHEPRPRITRATDNAPRNLRRLPAPRSRASRRCPAR